MFGGTLDSQRKFIFEDLDETQIDIGTDCLLNSGFDLILDHCLHYVQDMTMT